MNRTDNIYIAVDGFSNDAARKVGVITWNEEEKIGLKETIDVKNIACDTESTEFVALMIGVGMLNICKEACGGEVKGIYNDCKTAIDAVNMCKRGQFKKLTHNCGASLHNMHKDLNSKTIIEWISIKTEHT